MGITKWNSLEHVVTNIEKLGGIKYTHSGLFEKSDKLFKEDHRLTLKGTKSNAGDDSETLGKTISITFVAYG